jgi:heptosyltransferase-2
VNILLVKLDGIGDAVLAVPALRSLRRRFPSAHLTLVLRPPADELFRHAGLADRIVRADLEQVPCDIEKDGLRYFPLSLGNWRRAREFYRGHLADRPYDLAVHLRVDRDSYGGGYLVHLSRAPERIAFREKTTPGKASGNRFHDFLFTRKTGLDAWKHEVENNLALVRLVGADDEEKSIAFEVSPEDHAFADSLLPHREREKCMLIGIGATQRKRQWPLGCFREILERLAGRGYTCVLVGGREDGSAAAEMRMPGVVDLCGRSEIRSLYALMKGCRLFLGNDSGPMHLAAAAGVPVVEISSYPRSAPGYGSNCPLRFGPWGVPSRILQPAGPKPPCRGQCRSAEAHCITQVGVEDVWAAACSLLNL